jgi:gliding motility-associated-like protein
VIYTFDENVGYKYTIVVHPGADASKISMSYSQNSKVISDKRGGVLITSNNGTIIDQAPISYNAKTSTSVLSAFIFKKSNTVEFEIGEYDHSQDLIIDPLTVSPGFTTVNKGYDVARNPVNGDLFVYGGAPPYELKKFNASGTLIWTYATSSFYLSGLTFYGDMAIDPSGNVYLSNGCCENDIIKLNGTTLSVVWTTTASEPWRLAFDKANNRLIVGGFIAMSGDNVESLNATNGLMVNSATIIGAINAAEIRSMAMTPAGKVLLLHVSPYGSTTTNSISLNSANLINQYVAPSNYMLDELGAFYAVNEYTMTVCTSPECFHGINAIATTNSCFYTYDGSVIYKRNINTGAILGNVTVPGAISQQVSGIAVDSCGNVYAGTLTGIVQYDSSLVYMSTNTIGKEVYDIIVGSNSEMIACGDGFLSSFYYPCSSYYVSTSVTNVSCIGLCDGTASAVINGGTSPYSIHWSNGASTPNISGLCAGNYSVVVTDAVGSITMNQVTVGSPVPITININSVNTPCNANLGFAQANVTGGTGLYTYAWSPVVSSVDTINNLNAGTYIITVTDGNGCSKKDTVIITKEYPVLTLSNNSINCYGDCTGSSLASVILGSAPYSFLWNSGAVTQNIGGLCVGNYTCVVTDNYGCKDTAVTFIKQPSQITLTSSIKRCEDEKPNGQASVFVSGGTPGYSYLWNVSPLQTNSTISGLIPGSYAVVVSDTLNCMTSLNVIIPECPQDSINIPNVFTPNGDGVNDIFKIYNTGYTSLHCEIFNRWGIKVYEWDSLSGGWNGKINDTFASDGVYFYTVKAEKYDGVILDTRGFLHLIKN